MIDLKSREESSPSVSVLRQTLRDPIRVAMAKRMPDNPLYPGEAESIVGGGDARVASFATGRQLVRELAALEGYTLESIPTDTLGAPVMEPPLTASFSYSGPWCAVALSSNTAVAAIGIDIDRVKLPAPDAWDGICSARELRGLSPIDPALAVDLLFSAKEAFYKAQCPVTRNIDLEPRDIEVRMDPNTGAFTVEPAVSSHRSRMRVALAGGWCAAGVELFC